MATQQNSPSTISSNSLVGTVDRTSQSNALVEDAVYSQAILNVSNRTSYLICASDFGFSIPSGSTIDGIEIRYKARTNTNGRIRDEYCYVINPDGSVSTIQNKASQTTQVSAVNTFYTRGGPTDTRGKSRTAEDINNSNFGFGFAGYYFPASGTTNLFMDFMDIKIYYTPSVGNRNMLQFF